MSTQNPKPELDDLISRIKLGNLDAREFKYLTYDGILPVSLPDGTRVAVLPDIHVPAHNRQVMWAVLQFLRDFQPHIVIFIGDVIDIYGLTKWAKNISTKDDLQDELEETRRLADEIIEVSGCMHAFWIMGNHEDRVHRYVMNDGRGAAGMLDFNTREPLLAVPNLLGYGPDDPVTFIYDQEERSGYAGGIYLNDDMVLHHGYIVRPKPGCSPRADADKMGKSVTHGHTHRAGTGARVTTRGVLRWNELGHLVDPTHAYLGYANLGNNWHMALGAGHIVGGKIHLQTLPIKPIVIDGRPRFAFRYAGKRYVQSDR